MLFAGSVRTLGKLWQKEFRSLKSLVEHMNRLMITTGFPVFADRFNQVLNHSSPVRERAHCLFGPIPAFWLGDKAITAFDALAQETAQTIEVGEKREIIDTHHLQETSRIRDSRLAEAEPGQPRLL
jgi:hypothetical protein